MELSKNSTGDDQWQLRVSVAEWPAFRDFTAYAKAALERDLKVPYNVQILEFITCPPEMIESPELYAAMAVVERSVASESDVLLAFTQAELQSLAYLLTVAARSSEEKAEIHYGGGEDDDLEAPFPCVRDPAAYVLSFGKLTTSIQNREPISVDLPDRGE